MRRRFQDQRGFSVAWVVVTLPLLVAFMGLVLDLGVFLLKAQLLDAATDAAARAATDAWDREYWRDHGRVRLDPAQAESLARTYLARNMPEAQLKSVVIGPANRVTVRTELQVPVFFMRIAGWHAHTAKSFSTAVRVDA